jgi:WD40-like Beta Propeller Repeat
MLVTSVPLAIERAVDEDCCRAGDDEAGGPVAVVWLMLAGIAAPAALGAFPGANGRIVFQTTNGLGTLNAVGGDRQPLIGGTGIFAAPTWSPDGSRVAFSSNSDPPDFEIYMTGAQGGAVTRLTTNTAEDDAAAWSPDGRRLVFESDRDGASSLYVMNADSVPRKIGRLPGRPMARESRSREVPWAAPTSGRSPRRVARQLR